MSDDIIRVREGKILRIFLKEMTDAEINQIIVPKTGQNAGQQVKINEGKTHKLSMEVEQAKERGSKETINVWYQASPVKIMPGKPQVWNQTPDKGDTWRVINPGAVVDFNAKRQFSADGSKEFNAKINLNSFDLIQNGPPQETPFIYKANEQTQNTDGGYKKDFTGVQIGHAINAGLLAAKHNLKDVSKVLELSKNLHDITKTLKEEYKAKNPGMSDYDAGAATGHAVLNACRIGGTMDVISKNANIILDELVPFVSAYVKGEKVEAPQEDNSIPEDLPF